MIIKNYQKLGSPLVNSCTLCLLLFFLLGHCQVATASQLSPYTVMYDAKAKGIKLSTTRSLNINNNEYTLTQTACSLFASIEESSHFSLTPQSIQPSSKEYAYQQRIFGSKKSRKLLFNHQTQSIIYKEKGKGDQAIAYNNLLFDPLNYQVQIQLDLLSDPDKFTQAVYSVIDKGRIRDYQFTYANTEYIETKLGWFEAIKIERFRKKKNKRTSIWLAKDFEYLPLKILHQEQNKNSYSMQIVNGKINNTPINGATSPPKPATAANLSHY